MGYQSGSPQGAVFRAQFSSACEVWPSEQEPDPGVSELNTKLRFLRAVSQNAARRSRTSPRNSFAKLAVVILMAAST